MQVVKRDGRSEPVAFDKITARIKNLVYGLDPKFVDPVVIAQKVIQGVYNGVTTSELDELAAQTAAAAATWHPDFSVLAGRIAVSNLHKSTPARFTDAVKILRHYVHPKTGKPSPLIDERVYDVIMANAERFDAAIVDDRDFQFDYFGFKTLEKSYLLRVNGATAERPQYMFMRVAVGIHQGNVDAALETYDLMSQGFFVHATPTLFNAGTPKPQLSSCFLLTMQDDSIDGIYDTLKQCACISKYAGGIGLAVHNIRATGSYIAGTNGTSNGLVPMLRVFNMTARYVDQGGGKRKGSCAVYLEPWHADVVEFLELKKPHGSEEHRARDLFYALWVPDLFMKRVETGANWSLFCPHEAPGLADCYGEEFERLYTRYENTPGLARRTMPAQQLWFLILDSQVETGTPYLLFKDACNGKSNQRHLGTIKSSNLCTEIVEYTSPDEVAVCNLASLALPKYVNTETRTFDHARLFEVTKVVTRNLNQVIDLNFYPVPEARKSNMRHRPIGIGVQGLADVLVMMRMPFESAEALALNRDIFETIYFGACTASCELAEAHGAYETYAGSPASEGQLQFDLWGVKPSSRWDWAALKARIATSGMRNSLLVTVMPTASTAQILGNNESIEPFTSNLYTRRVLAGEFPVINRHMLKELLDLGLWTPEIRTQLIADKGSIQGITAIPEHIRELYKTVWEIKQRAVIDMAVARGPFICQSQSLNLHVADPNKSRLTSMHFHSWKQGLKTGMYYLRTKPRADAIQFTVDQELLAKARNRTALESKAPEAQDSFATVQPPVPVSAPISPAAAGAAPRKMLLFKAPQQGMTSLAKAAGQEEEEECLSCGS